LTRLTVASREPESTPRELEGPPAGIEDTPHEVAVAVTKPEAKAMSPRKSLRRPVAAPHTLAVVPGISTAVPSAVIEALYRALADLSAKLGPEPMPPPALRPAMAAG
jgi:hypothetical protein